MKAGFHIYFFLLVIIFNGFFLSACEKNEPKIDTSLHTITLYNKPLRVIKAYIKGTWKFVYAKGGYCGTCVFAGSVKHPLYMTITGKKIIFQSDSLGIVTDTLIYWKKAEYPSNQTTYLLTYHYSPGYAFPLAYIVDRIKNDSLILEDYASDPMYYIYSRAD